MTATSIRTTQYYGRLPSRLMKTASRSPTNPRFSTVIPTIGPIPRKGHRRLWRHDRRPIRRSGRTLLANEPTVEASSETTPYVGGAGGEAPGHSTPILGTRSDGCARAASGHENAVPADVSQPMGLSCGQALLGPAERRVALYLAAKRSLDSSPHVLVEKALAYVP
jgi:hypothetical protein